MSKYKYICIQPAHGGFGEYDILPTDGDLWDDQFDLLNECAGNVGEITELTDGAELMDGAEDIRGRIHNEPDAVYAYVDDAGEARYFGISAIA